MKHPENCFKKNPDFVTRKIAGEVILVPIKSSTKELNSLYTLNEVAGEAWELIDGKRSLREIQEAITSIFEVDEERAKKDLSQLFETLKEIEAIQEVSQ